MRIRIRPTEIYTSQCFHYPSEHFYTPNQYSASTYSNVPTYVILDKLNFFHTDFSKQTFF
jgi:hypothetical protein